MARYICATVLYCTVQYSSTYEDEREEPGDNGGPVPASVAVTTSQTHYNDPLPRTLVDDLYGIPY